MNKVQKKTSTWVVYLKSESCDDYGPFKFDNKPTDEELSELCHKCDGDKDKNGPGFDGSYCHIEHMDKA